MGVSLGIRAPHAPQCWAAPQPTPAAHRDKAEAGFCLPAGFTCTQIALG